MKRAMYTTILIAMLAALICSCSPQNKSSSVSPEPSEGKSIFIESTAAKNESSGRISVQSPMTLSNNDMYPINGRHEYIKLKLVKGRYYEDWNPGAIMGTIWTGSFVLEVADEAGKTIAQTDLSTVYSEPLTFTFSFQLEFGDYNDDGDVDFTIGQYASSNGREYKLFTVRKDGKIEELHMKDYPVLFISNSTGYYSTRLAKTGKTAFKKEYYDNSVGKHFEDWFQWEKGEFVHTKKQEIIR